VNARRDHAHISDTEARRLLENARNDTFAITLRVVLKSRCRGKWLSINEAAELANVSVRSLQRKLAARDVIFSDLVDGVRAELAAEMLENSDVAVGEIAAALGYSTASNFTRAFQRWTGETPAEFRRRAQKESELRGS
jgi:AraC-like DNA-binding protein